MDRKKNCLDPRIKGNITQDPFDTYDKGFKSQMQNPFEAFSSTSIVSQKDFENRQAKTGSDPIAVSLPPNLYIPIDAQSIDIRNLANVPPGETVVLLAFNGQQGNIVRFINYAVFFDALMFSLINLVPTVNKVRVFPFHGNPQFNYKIGLGLGPDLSNTSLIPCQLDLQPNDQLVWTFTNNDVVDVAAGVRMSGYLDSSTIRQTGRFGG